MQRIIPESFIHDQFLRSCALEDSFDSSVRDLKTRICTSIGSETEWNTLRNTNIMWKTDLRINFEI